MGILDQIVGNAGNTGQPRRGLLGAVGGAQGLLQNPATMDLGLALLANSGYQSRRRGFGEILGTSMLQSRQMAAEAAQQKLREQYMQAQIQAMQEKRQPAAEENEIVVGPDGKPVYVPRPQAVGREPYYRPGGMTSETGSLQEYKTAVDQGYSGTFMDYKREMAGITQTPRAPDRPPTPNLQLKSVTNEDGSTDQYTFNPLTGEMTKTGVKSPAPKPSPRDSTNLRKEFDAQSAVKAYTETLPLLQTARNAPDTGAGDLQLIYTAGKVLDPGSVVREGELLLFQKAGTPLQRLVGEMRFNASEGGRLSPQARQQILAMLNERVLGYRQGYDRERERFAGYAAGYGVDPETVVGDHLANAYQGARARASGKGGGQQDLAEGTVISNAQGKELVLRNGQWVPR